MTPPDQRTFSLGASAGIALPAPRITTTRFLAILLIVGGRPALAQEAVVSPHGPLANKCLDCHRDDGWRPARIGPTFDHKAVGFALLGAHGSATCLSCHQDLTFANAPTRCVQCHMDVHRGELGSACGTCHVERAFLDRSRMIQMHQTSRFALEGSHRGVDCESCHPPVGQGGLQYVGRSTRCESCHIGQYAAARNPDHQSLGFSRDCERCHRAFQWPAVRYDHSVSGFPVTGAHRALACVQCHPDFRYTLGTSTCVSCHQNKYDQTTAPNHAQAQFPTDCASCHSTAAWDTPFNHSRFRFPLTGAHLNSPNGCMDCHADGVYKNKPTTCESCHLTNFNSASSPDHKKLGWPTTCTTCHAGAGNTLTWDSGVQLPTQYHSMFNVNHQGAGGQCTQCHTTTTYSQSTCSRHHHPPSCTYLNERGCGD